MVCVPVPMALGVYVTEQDDELPEPTSVQLPPPLKLPAVLEEKLTVPEGRDEVPESVSETVAVQVEAEFTGTEDGEQTTVVPEVRLVAVTVSVPEEPLWSPSPP